SNTFYNFLGRILPLAVAVITIPILINKMGTERFGILTLAWMVIGYFGIFDLGVGRATTKFVSEYLALDKLEELPSLIWTSILMLFSLGLIGAMAGILATAWLVGSIFNIPPALVPESRQAFYLMAGILPFVLSSNGFRGVLVAQQRFGLINLVRTPAGLANFLAPLPVLAFSPNLFYVVAVLAGVRLLLWAVFCSCCLNSLPGMKSLRLPSLIHLRQLLGFGGWLTVSQVLYPIMMNMDRFFIGALLSMEAVAYYVTPYTMVTKLNFIQGSLVPVLFPACRKIPAHCSYPHMYWHHRLCPTFHVLLGRS
ncbi:MAG: oligosaccharide flippase family protein, partial [Syntrophobacterales bacterium]